MRKPGYSLRTYSVNQNLSLEAGNKLELICSLYHDDELVRDWDKPAFVVGNSDVMSVLQCEKLESGYCLTLSALSPGTSSLTISDGDSGAKAMVMISVLWDEQMPHSYIIDDVPSFYPKAFGDRETQTNIYNCNGLYVNKFSTELTKVDGEYILEFDVYNSLYMYGAVDVYNSSGTWIKSYRIDKHTSVQGLWDTAKAAVFLVRDTCTKNLLSYTAATYSSVTHVNISVPEGGYFTISANYAKSPGAFLYNSIDYMLLAAKQAADLIVDDNGLKEIQDATLEKVLASPEFTDCFYKQFSAIALNAGAEAMTGGYGALAGALTVHAGELFEHLKIDVMGIIAMCCGVGEDVLVALTPLGMGELLKAMYKFSELCDVTVQTVQIGFSMEKSYIAMYTPEATGELTMSGVTVSPDEGVLPDDSVAQVFRVANRDALVISDTGLVDVYEEYNISFVADGNEVQPDGSVTVKIPVPDDYSDDECIVLHQQEDGSWRVIDSAIKDGFIVFTVDHFSCFAVAPALKLTGICGSNVYWKLTDDGELIIVGSGEMNNYTAYTVAPWYESRSRIQSVKVGKGIKNIGNNAFYSCDALTSVSVADSVTRIGNAAFCFCSSLTEIELPEHLDSIGNSAFQDCLVLTDLAIPDTVTSIGYSAFRNCAALTEMILPDGLSSINTSTFYGCTGLTDIALQEGITTIGSSAFDGCSSLVKIDIPQGVTQIGGGAFKDCSALQEIKLPEQITYLDGGTFSGCSSLRSIVIPDSVDYLGAEVFYQCTSLAEVTLPKSLLQIEGEAFYSCSNLRRIALPDGLTYIGSSAFYNCGFAVVSIPCSVETISEMAFFGCKELEEAFIFADEVKLGDTAFWGDVLIFCHEGSTAEVYAQDNDRFYCSAPAGESLGHRYVGDDCSLCINGVYPLANGTSDGLEWTLNSNGAMAIAGTGTMKNYSYKSEMPWCFIMDRITEVEIGTGVTSIGDYAFYGMPNLTSVTIPDSVTAIGDYAFKNCGKLDGVKLPAGLTKLGDSAFYACSALTSIDIPASLYTVKPYTFKNCIALANVTFHEGNLQKISDGAFYNTALTEVTLPDCLDILDVYVFKNCGKLASVKLGNGLTQIREAVLYGTAISTIEIPEGVASIKPYAFKNCTNLVSVELPGTLVTVDEAAFYACTKLNAVELPDAVTSIGDYAFRKCTGLTFVDFGANLTTIGESSFYGCTGLTELVIPAKVTEIKAYAFKGCTDVSTVTLSESLTTIGDSAFHTCTGLSAIVIPVNVATIGEYCFSGSVNLGQITFQGDAPAIGNGAFNTLVATACYPSGNATWTSGVMQNYGGTITWKTA